MTKSYFQLKALLEETDNKPSKEQSGKLMDDVGKNFDAAVREAERRSEKAGVPNYAVYQNRDNPTEFMVRQIMEPQDHEMWRRLGEAKNGTYKADCAPCKTVGEALTARGRRALKRAAKRRKSSLKIARQRAKRRTAPTKKIIARAQKRARKVVTKQLTHGKKVRGNAALNRIQAMVNARHGQLDQIRRKLIPSVRKNDRTK